MRLIVVPSITAHDGVENSKVPKDAGVSVNLAVDASPPNRAASPGIK